jgi:hypothetical protein
VVLHAQQPAFPTAEGYGKLVTGGRGTTSTASTVFEVTNLTDVNTVGSLRYALSATATYRTIVFRISGTIHLTSKLPIKANTTIAGQTAPGDGICLADYPVTLNGNNIIVRYLRFRMGDKNELITSPANCGVPVAPFTAACMPLNGSGGDDAFGGTGYKNIIIDHCTSGWSNDEALTIYRGDSTTIQWCMMTESLNYAYHFETGDADFEHHGYGGIWGGQHASFHHNLFAHLQGRVPRFDGSRNLGDGATTGLENADFRNNVLYNWASYNVNGGEGGNYNIINNYYKYGPSTSTGSSSGVSIRYEVINPGKQTAPVLPYGKYYLSGNYVDGSTANTNNNWLGAAMSSGSYADTTSAKVTTPFSVAPINTHTALETYSYVLTTGGCSLPKRDTLDARIVNDVKSRTGRTIDCQGGYPHATPYATTVNAWPTLSSLTAPTDSDHDGMPDSWETARGLNVNDATDRNFYTVNGYTNLENYLNGDSIVAKGIANTCITSKAFVSSNSGNWMHATDTSSAILISTDTLNVFASVKDNANLGTLNASYYTTNTTRTNNARAYLNRNVTITSTASITNPVTVRLYLTNAELNTLKSADPLITSVADLKIFRTPATTCVTAIGATFDTLAQTTSGIFGTYANGFCVEFNTKSLGTFFLGGASFATGVSNISQNKFLKVLPNPFSNQLIIQSSYSQIIKGEIADASGRFVVNIPAIKTGFNYINTSALSKGVYVLKVMVNKEMFTQKIIKQ